MPEGRRDLRDDEAKECTAPCVIGAEYRRMLDEIHEPDHADPDDGGNDVDRAQHEGCEAEPIGTACEDRRENCDYGESNTGQKRIAGGVRLGTFFRTSFGVTHILFFVVHFITKGLVMFGALRRQHLVLRHGAQALLRELLQTRFEIHGVKILAIQRRKPSFKERLNKGFHLLEPCIQIDRR